MTPDHVRGRLSSDAGATSSSIIWPIVPSPIPTLSNAPSLTLSPTSTTNDKPIHRPFAGGLLRCIGNQSFHDEHNLQHRLLCERDAISLIVGEEPPFIRHIREESEKRSQQFLENPIRSS